MFAISLLLLLVRHFVTPSDALVTTSKDTTRLEAEAPDPQVPKWLFTQRPLRNEQAG